MKNIQKLRIPKNTVNIINALHILCQDRVLFVHFYYDQYHIITTLSKYFFTIFINDMKIKFKYHYTGNIDKKYLKNETLVLKNKQTKFNKNSYTMIKKYNKSISYIQHIINKPIFTKKFKKLLIQEI